MIHADVHHHYPRVATVTAYCLRGRMRDGNYVHRGAVASVSMRLGTHLTFRTRVLGVRRAKVEDTGRLAPGQIDVWTASCGDAIRWGRRTVRFRLGW